MWKPAFQIGDYVEVGGRYVAVKSVELYRVHMVENVTKPEYIIKYNTVKTVNFCMEKNEFRFAWKKGSSLLRKLYAPTI